MTVLKRMTALYKLIGQGKALGKVRKWNRLWNNTCREIWKICIYKWTGGQWPGLKQTDPTLGEAEQGERPRHSWLTTLWEKSCSPGDCYGMGKIWSLHLGLLSTWPLPHLIPVRGKWLQVALTNVQHFQGNLSMLKGWAIFFFFFFLSVFSF